MTSVEHLLANAFARGALNLPDTFQGLPGMAHGGSVLAAFDAVARQRDVSGPREIFGAYRRKVPLRTPLPLEVRGSRAGTEFVLTDGRHLLVEGQVSPADPRGRRDLPGDLRGGFALPVSSRCFACGTQNPLGLRVTLLFDEECVWTEYLPREPLRTDAGHLSTAAFTTLLDEAAFWLGALATGESGMTTELRVTLHRTPIKFGEPLIVIGQRKHAVARADDPRYWETETAVVSADRTLLATGRITFVTLKGAAKRLVTGALRVNPPEVLRRVFPAYMSEGASTAPSEASPRT